MLVKNTLEIIPSILIYAVLYLIANKVQIFEPTVVKTLSIDEMFSFTPIWILVYFSSYVSIPISYLVLFYKIKSFFIRSFLSLTFLSFTIFMLFPTTVPRFELDYKNMNSIYELLFKLLYSADSPTNCIPSLHVSTAFLIFYLSISFKRKLLISSTLVYAILVSLSTMFVKQHLFLDVVTGFAASSLIYFSNLWWESQNGKNELE